MQFVQWCFFFTCDVCASVRACVHAVCIIKHYWHTIIIQASIRYLYKCQSITNVSYDIFTTAICFFCFKSSIEITFEQMELWYLFFPILHVQIKNFASKIIKSKVSSDLKLLSCPKSTMLSSSVTDIAFIHVSLTAIWNWSKHKKNWPHGHRDHGLS